MTLRGVLLAALAGYYVQKLIYLPYGPAVRQDKEDRPVWSEIDPSNDSLQHKHGKLKKIYERIPEGADPILKGAETVVFDNDGTMFALTEEAKLVKLTDFVEEEGSPVITAKVTEVVHLGVGRPLGAKFASDGTIYIADAHLGLIRVKNPQDAHSKVELIASRVKDENGTWSQILYADDVAVAPKTGMVYFTDASDIAPDRIGTRTWDTMYMAKIDYIRGKKTGRLLQYDPTTDTTSIVASGFAFANGVAVDKDEAFVMIAETFGFSTFQYHLQGDKVGNLQVMAQHFTGYPDGADCSRKTGLCYAPLPSAALPLMKLIAKLPNSINMALRNLLLALPRSMAPKIVPYGGVVEIDPVNGQTRLLQDPRGEDIGMLTGVTVWDEKLYLGSLHNDYIGVYDLQ